ncbi:hypothetical protein SAMN05444266_102465 [Chitinophaga jiangningensis]|uniref:3-oxoacyl-ACP synthase n=1 Tax=Chitinophaga jiangningensis TaxID=1419482 RepID=A0A1M6YSR8_9BACT|nr:hypothetical protein [Chitinophaga jiangningensis]SHL21180.1 hypothetical protein SAMN05444266_102465 [Chitinophaga jiangningensis]
MTNEEKVAFKTRLKSTGEAIITERIAATKLAIDAAQEAANSEEKSSAGDKYETGRAMGNLQKDMYTRQLLEHKKELDQLMKVATNTVFASVQSGAFIQCASYAFYIAAGLGKQLIDDQQVFFLSPQAPLARLLLHKKPGDHFQFNKMELEILDVY